MRTEVVVEEWADWLVVRRGASVVFSAPLVGGLTAEMEFSVGEVRRQAYEAALAALFAEEGGAGREGAALGALSWRARGWPAPRDVDFLERAREVLGRASAREGGR